MRSWKSKEKKEKKEKKRSTSLEILQLRIPKNPHSVGQSQISSLFMEELKTFNGMTDIISISYSLPDI